VGEEKKKKGGGGPLSLLYPGKRREMWKGFCGVKTVTGKEGVRIIRMGCQ